MPLGLPGRRNEPLHVVPMALALTLAAFAGGALGVLWHQLSNGPDEREPPEPVEQPTPQASPATG